MILLADSEGPDQTAQKRRLIWAFAVHICSKKPFCMAQPIYLFTYTSMNIILSDHFQKDGNKLN